MTIINYTPQYNYSKKPQMNQQSTKYNKHQTTKKMPKVFFQQTQKIQENYPLPRFFKISGPCKIGDCRHLSVSRPFGVQRFAVGLQVI